MTVIIKTLTKMVPFIVQNEMIKYLWAEMLALGWARPRLVTVKGMLHKLIIQGACYKNHRCMCEIMIRT